MTKQIQKYSSVQLTALALLGVITLFWLGFALLSGSLEYEGSLEGMLRNSPNALPWLIPIALLYVVWKWQRIGGFLFLVLGLVTVYFFSTYESIVTFLIISTPYIILGSVLLFTAENPNTTEVIDDISDKEV